MKLISEIIEDMMEEVHDAKHRIERAGELKPLYPEIAQRECEIAKQELAHANKDHKSVEEVIEAYKKTKGDPPEYMLEFWQEKHKHYMEKYANVKHMIEMYDNE